MSLNQHTLRSFLNAEGKLLLCNEPFFQHFGHCRQHLVGRTVNDVFSYCECDKILQAVRCCQSDPGRRFTVRTEKRNHEGCTCFQWQVFAEHNGGKITGIHLLGWPVKTETAAA